MLWLEHQPRAGTGARPAAPPALIAGGAWEPGPASGVGIEGRTQGPWLGHVHPTRQGAGSPGRGGPQGAVEGTKGSTEVVGQNPVLAPHQTARHLSRTPLFTAPAPGYMQELPQDKPGASAPWSRHHPACPPSASGWPPSRPPRPAAGSTQCPVGKAPGGPTTFLILQPIWLPGSASPSKFSRDSRAWNRGSGTTFCEDSLRGPSCGHSTFHINTES